MEARILNSRQSLQYSNNMGTKLTQRVLVYVQCFLNSVTECTCAYGLRKLT